MMVMQVLRSRKRTAKQHTVLPTSTLTKPASSKQAMILDTGSHLPVAEDETRPSRTTSTRAVYDCIVTTGQSTISEAGAVAVSMDPEALESRDMTSAHDGASFSHTLLLSHKLSQSKILGIQSSSSCLHLSHS